jgi:hypothetical protein
MSSSGVPRLRAGGPRPSSSRAAGPRRSAWRLTPSCSGPGLWTWRVSSGRSREGERADEDGVRDIVGEGGEAVSKRGRGQRKGSRGHGRRDYSHLPTREEVHDVAPGERVCPCCGADYVAFGEETCEQIDWRVQLIRIVHRRPTYRRTCRCPVRGVLVAPPVGKVIGKGRFTTVFWPGCWSRSSCWAPRCTGSSPRWPTTGWMWPREPWPGCSRRARLCWARSRRGQ